MGNITLKMDTYLSKIIFSVQNYVCYWEIFGLVSSVHIGLFLSAFRATNPVSSPGSTYAPTCLHTGKCKNDLRERKILKISPASWITDEKSAQQVAPSAW